MLTEHRDLAALVLGLLISATVSGLLVLVRQQARGVGVLLPRQVQLRLLGGLLLLAIWGLLGFLLLGLKPLEQPEVFLFCFYVTLLLTCVLPFLALLDLRLLSLSRLRAEMRLSEEYIRACATHPARHES